MAAPVPDLADRASACAAAIRRADAVLLASHIDADGLTSAAVASRALERAGITHDVVFKKQLDETEIASIAAREFDTVLFTDFGSGQLDVIAAHEAAGDFTPVIADHHQPADADTEFHLNPLLEGIDGASDLSGAGASYVLARALEDDGVDNRDLAALAVVGAVGDMQAAADGELTGANRAIVEDGTAVGALAETTDLALYGKQTRPLPKLLEYASEIEIPGISNDERGAIAFLEDLDVPVRVADADAGGVDGSDGSVGNGGSDGSDGSYGSDGGDGSATATAGGSGDTWRRWVDLSTEERRTLASALVRRAIDRGVPADRVDGLVGTTYTLSDEPPGTELRDASEFSTLLNATARYDRADVGLAVCLGNRNGALDRARTLLANHRRNLSEGLNLVGERGVESAEHLQYFDAGEEIRETIVGIVAGMALGLDGVRADRPIVAFARKNDEETKVSARGTGRLVGQGLDLSVVVGEAARAVGGDGGGHDVAAGATVPRGAESEFVERADELVGSQLG